MKIQLKFAALLMLATALSFTACAGGTDEDSKSGAKAITAFSFTSPAATGIINEADHTIAVAVPWNTDVTSLVPTITHNGANISPATGVVNNFTGAQTYMVTAADGSTQAYTVTVTIKEYVLRVVGPAGGWIFYINPNAATDGWKYLEAAPVDQTSRAWGTSPLNVTGADGTAIGTGEQNTLDIIQNDTGTPDKAADECANYSVTNGGITYDDWFLPSKDELAKIYVNLKSGTDEHSVAYTPIGGFADDYYRSSTETGLTTAYGFGFGNNSEYTGMNKSWSGAYVRAVRYF
jgi:hypothetical protein